MPDRQIGVTAGEAVLAEAVAVCKKDLGERLIAAYALGSLTHGGFSPLVSDVDLGVVLSDPVEQSDNAAIQKVADAVEQEVPTSMNASRYSGARRRSSEGAPLEAASRRWIASTYSNTGAYFLDATYARESPAPAGQSC